MFANAYKPFTHLWSNRPFEMSVRQQQPHSPKNGISIISTLPWCDNIRIAMKWIRSKPDSFGANKPLHAVASLHIICSIFGRMVECKRQKLGRSHIIHARLFIIIIISFSFTCDILQYAEHHQDELFGQRMEELFFFFLSFYVLVSGNEKLNDTE